MIKKLKRQDIDFPPFDYVKPLSDSEFRELLKLNDVRETEAEFAQRVKIARDWTMKFMNG